MTWRDPERIDDRAAAALIGGLDETTCRWSGCRAALSCEVPRPARYRARSGSAASSRRARRSICSSSAPARPASAPRCTAPPRGWTRSSSRARDSAVRPARRGGSRTTSDSRPGSRGSELTSRAVTQARKFDARLATPYRALSARARQRPPRRAARGGSRDRRPRRPDRHRRPVPTACRSTTSTSTRASASSTPPARPRPSCAAPSASPWSAAATRPGRRRSGSPAAARSSRCCTGARDLRETMSDYLVRELERVRSRGARPQRDRRPARERRAARGGHARRAASAFRSPSCSSSSARCRAPNGSTTPSRRDDARLHPHAAPHAGAEQPARNERARASSRPATSARVRPSVARPPSAKGRGPSSSSTPTCRLADSPRLCAVPRTALLAPVLFRRLRGPTRVDPRRSVRYAAGCRGPATRSHSSPRRSSRRPA